MAVLAGLMSTFLVIRHTRQVPTIPKLDGDHVRGLPGDQALQGRNFCLDVADEVDLQSVSIGVGRQ
ncbi:hypothetical protein ACKLTP_19310, partial [Paenarthrobacter ureafaciens]|uniref:hypothetical protein n=1 Tax=Paenarthrobacter ureafaciens TaxID=37931 RepID=UPI00397B8C19